MTSTKWEALGLLPLLLVACGGGVTVERTRGTSGATSIPIAIAARSPVATGNSFGCRVPNQLRCPQHAKQAVVHGYPGQPG